MNIQLTVMETLNSFHSSVDSQVFTPENTKVKQSKIGKQRNLMKSKNVGHWSPAEKQLYYVFLTAHKENFLRKQLRRTDKIFKQMSKFVKTRAADQCRSHHQKMEKKFLTFDEILNSIKEICGGKDYTLLLKTFENQETKHMSPQITSTLEIIETGINEKENTGGIEFDFDLQSQPVSYQELDELELAINTPCLWGDEIIDIDNYFLM